MAAGLGQNIDVAALYDELTDGLTMQVRIDELVYAAADRVPGLVPTRQEIDVERERKLADKAGLELAQGLLLAQLLALPREGTHLLEAMLAPTQTALEHLDEFITTGRVQLGPVTVTCEGKAGFLELSNPRHLNAEDGTTLAQTEAAVDLIQLHPEIEVGVLRGGVIDRDQRKYGGQRVFGAGINLTHLYYGKIDFLFYLLRDWGYVNKLFRGTLSPDGTIHEKLWVAVVEQFAIGGHCQLLHCMDYVIATRGARLSLPARKEGIIPGASNLRLPRFVGERAARQAILWGREWRAGDPDAEALVDVVVEPEDLEETMRDRISAVTDSGLVSAVGNRRVIRLGAEPPELYRQYMSVYAHEQALCHLSPALVENLERHWNAPQRSV
jgi:enoyl-CoA hydratase/carnithine racemase